MKTPPKKRGRKSKPHIAADGSHIEGLRFREHDKRWILADGRTFTEPDEERAIERFRAMTGGPFPPLTADEEKKLNARLRNRTFDVSDNIKALVERSRSENCNLVIIPSRLPLWEYVAMEIRTRPKWVAEQTGIEQIGYFRDIKAPETLPTFKQIEDEWDTHYAKSYEQKRRVMDAWKDFKTTTKIKGLDDITSAVCGSFCDNVIKRKLAAKSQSNMFTRIRRLFTWLQSRDVAPDAMERIVKAMKRLVAEDCDVSLNPSPISPEDFHELLKAADHEGKAMLLLMLNGAFTLTEVIRLKWDEIKADSIVTRRKKSGRCIRVCVLWQETVDALAKIKSPGKEGEYVFHSREGSKLTTSGADKRFRVIRKNAEKVSDSVTASHLRDGAATALAVAIGQRDGIFWRGGRCWRFNRFNCFRFPNLAYAFRLVSKGLRCFACRSLALSVDVVFVDEIHELNPLAQTTLYRCLEERRLFLPSGPRREPQAITLPPFTFVGATTDEFRLSKPLRDRMKIIARLVHYSDDELAQLMSQRSKLLGWKVEEAAVRDLAVKGRGTPRISIRLLEAARRVSRAEGADAITLAHVHRMMEIEGVDSLGLDTLEQHYMHILKESSSPVRLNVLATMVGLPRRTIESVIESELLRLGMIMKDDGGRMLTPEGREHLNRTVSATL